MTKQLTIQQWFARAVAAGIAPDWDNVWAYNHCNLKIVGLTSYEGIEEEYNGQTMSIYGDFTYFDRVQLRKDGVDLVELEWIKPTKESVGEMCWFANENKYRMPEIDAVHDLRLIDNSEDDAVYYYAWGSEYSHSYCLLATNGNIAPKPEDFRKAYGE